MNKSKNISQLVRFKAKPGIVYAALLDSKTHSAFTGSRCVIGKKVGGFFSTFDGYAEGKNLELIPDKKIVQFWRASDWPNSHYSEVIFEFKKIPSGTLLKFKQNNVPAESAKEIAAGWKEFYWEPLKTYLKK